MNHIFISHKTADDRAVDQLVRDLEGRGFTCWVDHRDIHHNLDNDGFFAAALSRAVKESCAVILFVSSALNANEDSEYLLLEIMRATELKKPRIRLDYETADLPEGIAFMFTGTHHFSFVGRRRSDTLDQLCERLEKIVGVSPTPNIQVSLPQEPLQPPPPSSSESLSQTKAPPEIALMPQPVTPTNQSPSLGPDAWTPPPVTGPSGALIFGGLFVLVAAVTALSMAWPSLKSWTSSAALPVEQKSGSATQTPRDSAAMSSEGIALASRGDLTAAVPLLKEAAELGDTTAMVELGKLYYYGRGVPEDEQEAMKWFKLAEAKGDALGKELRVQLEQVWGKRETAKAAEQARNGEIERLRTKAVAGDVQSQVDLAIALVAGKDQKEHIAEAIQWLRKAADQGEVKAMNELGGVYLQGFGVERDVDKAREWYGKAASKGYAPAKHNFDLLNRNEAGKSAPGQPSAGSRESAVKKTTKKG
jgi:TPR repeat protein